MRPRVAKSGTIYIQHSMFSTDERDALTTPADDDTHEEEEKAKAESLPDVGKTPRPDDLSAAPGYTVSAKVAYEAMMDAMRDNIDPLMVEVKTDCGMYVRLCSCTVRSINNAPLSAYEVLKIVRMDRQDEILAARTEDENLVTDDWSM